MPAVIKTITGAIVKLIQKTVVTASLLVIYVFGLGLTVIAVIFFHRSILTGGPGRKDTSWSEAEGYEPDIGASSRQS